jgi:hypothetical protein
LHAALQNLVSRQRGEKSRRQRSQTAVEPVSSVILLRLEGRKRTASFGFLHRPKRNRRLDFA